MLLLLLACHPWPIDDSDGIGDSKADSDTDTDADTDTDSDSDTDTNTDPTWSGDVYPIEVGSCESCHSQWGTTSGDLYRTWTTMSKDGTPFITPGDPSQSFVYLKLTAPPEGSTMPLQLGNVSDSDLSALRAWITSGAANDAAFISSMAHIYDVYACDDCHSDWANHGDTAALYATITSKTGDGYPYIDPGNPDDSYIYLKVSSDTPPKGARMPRKVTPLTTTQIDAVGGWITAGALDN